MTQMFFILAEHTEEVSVMMSCLTVVLLFVTLHRMKRITRMIQGIAGNTKEKDAQALREFEKAGHFLASEDGNEVQNPQEKLAKNTEEEALISEVLEEVFP